MAEIKITVDNFADEMLNSKIPVLVDFWATWCGPCMMLAPVIGQIADEFDGKIKVGKINVDEDGALASLYGIQSIPTIILFNDGKEIGKKIGLCGRDEIVKMFGDLIK